MHINTEHVRVVLYNRLDICTWQRLRCTQSQTKHVWQSPDRGRSLPY